ncbi:MAG: hypothetical protein Q9208_007797 [Pyrenodesmia sp. 3 TL-2023]
MSDQNQKGVFGGVTDTLGKGVTGVTDTAGNAVGGLGKTLGDTTTVWLFTQKNQTKGTPEGLAADGNVQGLTDTVSGVTKGAGNTVKSGTDSVGNAADSATGSGAGGEKKQTAQNPLGL